MLKIDNQTLLMVFIAVTGAAVLLQAIILFFLYRAISGAIRSLSDQADDLRTSLMPVIFDTRDLFSRMTPKIESTVEKAEVVVGDMAEITQGLKIQTAEAQVALGELLERTRIQTVRIDGMLTAMLGNIDRAGSYVNQMVSKPARQISSVMATVKAVVNSLRTPLPPRR